MSKSKFKKKAVCKDVFPNSFFIHIWDKHGYDRSGSSGFSKRTISSSSLNSDFKVS